MVMRPMRQVAFFLLAKPAPCEELHLMEMDEADKVRPGSEQRYGGFRSHGGYP